MDWHERSATAMVAALAEGEITSVALVEALQARADRVEPAIHGFTAQYRETALRAAAAADAAREAGEDLGPLHGLPVTVKENLALEGTPATMGIRPRRARIAETTAPIVRGLLDAGAIVLGKTNVPQLLLAMESDNPVFGTTCNPWDLERVPGGSSGGEAALIAAGASPAGVGTDIGGSIRNPAAYCGIAGLKPTWSRWSVQGSAGGQPGQEAVRAQSGPMARTVGDLVLLCQALSPERQHRLDPTVPPLPLADPGTVDLTGITVGWYEDDGILTPAASVRRAVREAVAHLEDAGARVVPYVPPRAWEMFDTYFGLMSADGFATAHAQLDGDPPTQQLATLFRLQRLPRAARGAIAAVLDTLGERRVARLLRNAGEKSVTRFWELVARRDALKRAEAEAWRAAGIDLLVGPPTCTPAPRHRRTHDWSIGAWHCMRYNLLDLPAGVLPVTRVREDETARLILEDRLDRRAAEFEEGSTGLPVAAQVIGRPWEEHLVLAAMSAIEAGVRSRPDAPVTPVDPLSATA